jgi:hypothetical protein
MANPRRDTRISQQGRASNKNLGKNLPVSAGGNAALDHRPQVDLPGSHMGIGAALLATVTVATAFAGADLAAMWSAAKPVMSIPRTRARTAIFMGLVL